MTRTAVIEHVRRGRARTRRDLSRLLGLSRSAVAQTVSELVAEGLLTEQAPRATDRPGRPSTRLTLVPRRGWVAAIDVNHREVAVAVGDLEHHILAEDRRPWSVDVSGRETLALADAMLGEALGRMRLRHADLAAVGMALPFPVAQGRVAPVGDVPTWADLRPAELLTLPPGRAVVRNCSDVGAWGEFATSSAGVRSLVYVDVGDGVGSALVVDGVLFSGTHGLTGEIGHVTVPGCTVACRCGRVGCLDALVSSACDEPADPARRAAAADAVGAVLAQLASFVDPDLVVLGGSLADDPMFFGRVAEAYGRREPLRHCELRRARLGGRAPLCGALDLATQEAWARAV